MENSINSEKNCGNSSENSAEKINKPTETPTKESGKKPKRAKYVDDGHTVYSMAGLDDRPKNREREGLTRKERRAAIRAALSVYMPRLLLVIACFVVTGIILYFWLR